MTLNKAAEGRTRGRLARLAALDRMYLLDERPAWPCHFVGLAIVEGEALVDGAGRLRLGEVRRRLDRRLVRVPGLRRRVHCPGPLRGGPLWVDDEAFRVEHHVHETAVPSPGDDRQLLEVAARICGQLLDRRRPLWELWFVTGLSDGRIGVLLKLHHAVADGNAAVAIMRSLFDLQPDALDPVAAPWTPEPVPGDWSLLTDAFASKVRALGGVAALLAHPRRLIGGARVFALVLRQSLGAKGAPRTSLNQVVRPGRRVRFVGLDLASIKKAAHAHEGTVNDVVLDLWSGGLRQLMAKRGELRAGLELVTAQAVSLRSGADGSIDNQAGTMVLRLPVWEPDPRRRLDLIVAMTRRAKSGLPPAAIMGVLIRLSATPIGRYLNLHQRAINVLVTNVVGPPAPMYAFGARILDILPIIQLVGNVGLTLCAFSYAGRVSLVVTADAAAFPDLDVLMAGMEQDWDALHGRPVEQPVDVRPRAGHRVPASRPVLATQSAPTQTGEQQ